MRLGKYVVIKAIRQGQCWKEALAYVNSTPRSDGWSPAEIFLGCRPRTALPEIDRPVDIAAAKEARSRADAAEKDKNRNHAALPAFTVGETVWMQSEVGPDRGRWTKLCKILEVRSLGRSYYVK